MWEKYKPHSNPMTSLSCMVTVYVCYCFSTFNWYVIKAVSREIKSAYVSESRASASCLLTIGTTSLFFIFTLKMICKCRFNLVTYADRKKGKNCLCSDSEKNTAGFKAGVTGKSVVSGVGGKH